MIEDGGRLKPSQKRFHVNSDRSYQSPQMSAALQSVRNYHQSNKIYDQHVRPSDRLDKAVPIRRDQLNNDLTDEFYNHYYVPSNQLFYY